MKESQASQTAYIVARGVLSTIKNPEFLKLVDNNWATAYTEILSLSSGGQKYLQQLDSSVHKKVQSLLEWAILPSVSLHYVLRKKYIEEYCRRLIDQKLITQVVNLGAGFDTLAYRLSSEYPQINFIEIDYPATQQEKLLALQNHRQFNKNLHLLPVDFTHQNLESELSQFQAFDTNEATLFISEGVIMYLKETEAISLFNTLKTVTKNKVFFIFTAASPTVEHGLRGFLLKQYLKSKNEPFLWLQTPNELKSFLTTQNYMLQDVINAQYFKKHYLPLYQGYLQQNEYIAITENIEKDT
ncbi:MAG: class I SAM-dependent methyltransferase [Thiotrichaceae bacterium]|nr:class I SAM-dependent methyltransferase [Thiotrichaceae bacterium]